jgi:hypothetical protein
MVAKKNKYRKVFEQYSKIVNIREVQGAEIQTLYFRQQRIKENKKVFLATMGKENQVNRK